MDAGSSGIIGNGGRGRLDMGNQVRTVFLNRVSVICTLPPDPAGGALRGSCEREGS